MSPDVRAPEAPCRAAGVSAVVPAHDEERLVGETVRALLSIQGVDEVIVVDDGSSDATAERARAAGARVLRLARNRGKAAAVGAGIRAATAPVLMLCDADLGATAAALAGLLPPVAAGDADMAIAAPPPGAPSGFGLVEGLARWGIGRLAGLRTDRPLSGQRAVRREALKGIRPAAGFGLEVALTVDLVRAGRRVVEVPCAFTHERTGRTPAGFVHRGRQALAIGRTLLPRALPRPGARA